MVRVLIPSLAHPIRLMARVACSSPCNSQRRSSSWGSDCDLAQNPGAQPALLAAPGRGLVGPAYRVESSDSITAQRRQLLTQRLAAARRHEAGISAPAKHLSSEDGALRGPLLRHQVGHDGSIRYADHPDKGGK